MPAAHDTGMNKSEHETLTRSSGEPGISARETSTENTFANEPDRVIIYDDFALGVIHDVLFDEFEAEKLFAEQFDIIRPRGHFMADPDEDFYQGMAVMSVIKRKLDGRRFGFAYWTPVAKNGEAFIEANGDDNGLKFEVGDGFNWDTDYFPKAYVWLPIEPFTVIGYKIAALRSTRAEDG